MDLLKKGQRTKTWPPIHYYENCSMAQGNIKERFASASWAPSHALVHDVPDAEIFSTAAISGLAAEHWWIAEVCTTYAPKSKFLAETEKPKMRNPRPKIENTEK